MPEIYQCRICNEKVDTSKETLVDHLETKHGIIARSIEDLARNFKHIE